MSFFADPEAYLEHNFQDHQVRVWKTQLNRQCTRLMFTLNKGLEKKIAIWSLGTDDDDDHSHLPNGHEINELIHQLDLHYYGKNVTLDTKKKCLLLLTMFTLKI